jgi:tetratricopeptide (TPR) repeat protein
MKSIFIRKRQYCFLAVFLLGTVLYAQSTLNPRETQSLPRSFNAFRDAVYMQNAGAVQIASLSTAAREEIEQTLDGANRYIALSRCAYLTGIAFHAEGGKAEAAAYYDQGIAWAEDSLSLMPTSEGYQYLAANIALACLVKPASYALANFKKIDETAQKALALNPRNLAAQYVIAAKYILSPWPVENMKKGAGLIQEIMRQDMGSLEKEDLCNIYLAMALICEKEKKTGEQKIWQGKALALYPTNRFRETLLRQMGK